MPKTPGEMQTALSWGSGTCKRPGDPDELCSEEVLLNRVFNKLTQQMQMFR